MMRILKYLIIIALVQVIGISCTSEKKAENNNQQMLFQFDSTRVEKSVLLGNNGLQINPPKGMIDITASVGDKTPILGQIPFSLSAENTGLYFNLENKGVMITSFSQISIAARQLEIVDNTPLKLNSEESFVKDDLMFHQYIYSDANNVMLIILIPDQDIVTDIIFMIPRESYNEYSRNIESSLGSIIRKEVKTV